MSETFITPHLGIVSEVVIDNVRYEFKPPVCVGDDIISFNRNTGELVLRDTGGREVCRVHPTRIEG